MSSVKQQSKNRLSTQENNSNVRDMIDNIVQVTKRTIIARNKKESTADPNACNAARTLCTIAQNNVQEKAKKHRKNNNDDDDNDDKDGDKDYEYDNCTDDSVSTSGFSNGSSGKQANSA